MIITVEDYWPIVAANTTITKVFDGYVQYLLPDHSGGTVIRQLQVETSDWYYRHDPIRGIVEYKDVYPSHTARMLPGYEIIWGGGEKFPATIGGTISASCAMAGPFGNSWFATWGWQQITFLAIEDIGVPAGMFRNCLKLRYVQPWNKKSEDGGVLWLAPALGMVQANWIAAGIETQNWSRLQYLNVASR